MTPQGAAAPCSFYGIGKYEHGVGVSLFGLGGPNIPSLSLFLGETGPLATTLHSGPCKRQYDRKQKGICAIDPKPSGPGKMADDKKQEGICTIHPVSMSTFF